MNTSFNKVLRKAKSKEVEFKPNRWKHYLNSGCYPYALNLELDEFYLIGDFIGNRCNEHVSDDFLINILLQELDFLGFNVKECPIDAISEGKRKIYLARNLLTGFYHLYREDNDGTWSDKSPNALPSRIKNSPHEIIDELNGKISNSFTGWCFLIWKK